MALLLAIIVGLVIGVIAGGSFSNIGRVRIHYLWLVVAALVVQMLIFSRILGTNPTVLDIGPYIYIVTLLASLFVMLRNFHIPGMKIIALGAALNAIVIIANGGYMPAPEDKLRDAGRIERVEQGDPERAVGTPALSNSKIADDDTRLLFLGDVIAIPDWVPLSNVISIGDIIIAIGAGYATAQVMRTGSGSARRTRLETAT